MTPHFCATFIPFISQLVHFLAIQYACENRYVEIVMELLCHPRVDPTAEDNQGQLCYYPFELELKRIKVIQLAAKNGHTKVVEILLQDSTVNPCAHDNYDEERII